jgi:hypothetical protein
MAIMTSSALTLTQEIEDLVNGSLESGNPILLAAVWPISNVPVRAKRSSVRLSDCIDFLGDAG